MLLSIARGTSAKTPGKGPWFNWAGLSNALDHLGKKTWLPNLLTYCKYEQLVASIMWALGRLWPKKAKATWLQEFTGARSAATACQDTAAIVCGVRKVMACEEDDDNGRFAHATIVRDHINSLLNRLLPAGSRGIPLFPHKFKAAPAVRVDQRGLAEVVQAYIKSREPGALTLPADVAGRIAAEFAHDARGRHCDKS